MKRLLSIGLICVLALCALPAHAHADADFDALMRAGALRLTPVTWFDESARYTLVTTAKPFTVTEDWLKGMGLEDAGEETIGLASDVITMPLPDAEVRSLLSTAKLLSVSPSGALLVAAPGSAALVDGDRIRALHVDLARSQMTEEKPFEYAMRLGETIYRLGVGRTGVLWSTGGSHAMLTNATYLAQSMQNNYGLTLLDAEDGSLYMPVSGARMSLRDPSFSILFNAFFDERDNALYCMAYENKQMNLVAFDPVTAERRTLCTLEYTIGCEGMGGTPGARCNAS